MKFGATNKVHQDINERFGENAVLLEERMKVVNWRYFLKFYCAIFGVVLASLFLLIVVIRAALSIF